MQAAVVIFGRIYVGSMAGASGHGDRKGRHYYTTLGPRSPYIVVAGLAPRHALAVAMLVALFERRKFYGRG